jgi:hypothetical protein
VLAAGFAAIRGVRPSVFAPLRGFAKRRVDQRTRPLERPSCRVGFAPTEKQHLCTAHKPDCRGDFAKHNRLPEQDTELKRSG